MYEKEIKSIKTIEAALVARKDQIDSHERTALARLTAAARSLELSDVNRADEEKTKKKVEAGIAAATAK